MGAIIIGILSSVVSRVLAPVDGYKTVIGVGVGAIAWIARLAGVEVPVIDVDASWIDVLYSTLVTLGLQDKARKAGVA